MPQFHTLSAISPVDGRYHAKTNKLAEAFSEFTLIKARLRVEIDYLIALSRWPDSFEYPLVRIFTDGELELLEGLLANFSLNDAQTVQAIERTGWGPYARTNHDVKAVELWLRSKLEATSLADV